jgi:hypothetical protein
MALMLWLVTHQIIISMMLMMIFDHLDSGSGRGQHQ